MKTKLLKKLRRKGRDQIHILSTTKSEGFMIGMSISYSDDAYSGMFEYGDSEEEVLERAARLYLKLNIEQIRKKYLKKKRC